MHDGGGLSLENTCHGMRLIGCLWSLAESVLMWVLIFFFFLSFDLGSWLFTGG
jgi:hypothetical protein